MPIDDAPALAVTTPFYESDIAVDDIRFGNNLLTVIGDKVREKGLARADVGLVGTDVLPLALYQDLVRELPGVKFFPADDIVMNLRAIKSDYELKLLRKGAQIADLVCQEVKTFITPGKKESDVGNLIVELLQSQGVTMPFATCQSGQRSKEPYDHVPVSDKVIEDGDMIHMEINGRYSGYMIDICRSTVAGRATEDQRRILELTLRMLDESIAAAKPGVKAEDLERVSGRIALENGLGPNHTAAYGGPGTYLGHAIGLGVDEPPCLAEGDKTLLKAGMVLTIEPGLYRTPHGGCRIEDEVLVGPDGPEVLNKDDRKWWD
ncbi:MAG: aminopeptidase P family protein [Deltaproteobacteria bacterium]|nr:aminopeptidase P family protein [Deltaproteobacteria bacterium]